MKELKMLRSFYKDLLNLIREIRFKQNLLWIRQLKWAVLVSILFLFSNAVSAQTCTNYIGNLTPSTTWQTVYDCGGYYAFSATAGSTYEFSFCSNGGSYSGDPYLTITSSPTTNNVTANDDYCGLGSYLQWTATSTQTYYIHHGNFGGGCGGYCRTMAYFLIPAPVAPVCASAGFMPAQGDTNVVRSPAISWTAVQGATSYDVYLGTTNPPPFVGNVSSATYSPTNLNPSTMYYWRVIPRNISGPSVSACTILSFTTACQLPQGGIPNGAGGLFNYACGSTNQQIALAACESFYGVGNCSVGSCGAFSYYYQTGQLECNCYKPSGSYEWIFGNTGYSQVGEDYGGQSTNVAGNSLFARQKISGTCDQNSWTLTNANLAGSGCGGGGTISAPLTSICFNNMTGFRVSSAQGATAYTWSLPSGASFVNGQGTDTITIIMGSNSGNLSVIPSNACGNASPITIALTSVQIVGNNTISAHQTLCSGSTPAVLTGSMPTGGNGNFVYQWLSSSDDITWAMIPSAQSQSYTPGAILTNTYYRRQVSSGGCFADTSASVSISLRLANPITGNSISGSQSLCAGIQPAAFTSQIVAGGNGIFTYEWQSSADHSNWSMLMGATQALITPNTIMANTYFRRIITSDVCALDTSASVSLLLYAPISNNSTSASQSLCAPGTPQGFVGSIPSGGSGSYSYVWQSSVNNTMWVNTGVTSSGFNPGFVSSSSYFRRIVSSTSCLADTSNTIHVLVAPIVNLISSSQTINFEAIPSGFTGITNAQNPNYIWETSRNNFHWNVIQGAVNANYAESSPMTQWAWYRRKISASGCDTAISNTVMVQLNNLPHDSITITTNGPLCTPSPLYLNVHSTIPGLTYNWTGPNGFMATGFNPSISMPLEANTGVYRCVATDTSRQDSFVATMHVWVSPIMSALNVAYNQPVCEGSTLNISAAGMPGVAYSWTGPSGFTSDRNEFGRAGANTSMDGMYSLVASSPGCGSITRSLNVQVTIIPNPNPGNNTPICTSNVLNFTATIPAGSTALWAGPNGYTSALYQPSIGSAQTIQSGTYTLTVTRPGCQPVIQTTTAQVNAPVTGISIGSNSPVCLSGALQLSATASGALYQWTGPNGYTSTMISPSLSNVTNFQNGVYTLQVVSPGCGSISRTTQVQIITPGAISAGSNSPICAGTTLAFTSTAVPGATILWEGPNGFNSSIANPSISSAQTMRSGVYTVTVTSPGCTPSVGTTTVTVSSSVSSLVAVSNSPVCEGSAINLSVPSVNGVTYTWTGPQAFTAIGNTASVPNAAMANAGNYILSMTSPGCASVNRSLNVVVRSSSAAIAGSNSPRCTGSVLYLTVNTTIGATYLWQGPNGFMSTQQNPSLSNVQPLQSGDYSLTVSFAGCGSTTQSTPIVVYPNATGIQISAAQTLCAGSPLALTGTSVNGATMSWTGPGAFTATGNTGTVPVTTTANSGRYAYSVSMPGCGTVTRYSNVTIMDAAAVNGTITTPLCTGNAMYMNSAFIAGATYQWQSPDGFNSTQRSPSRIRVTVPMAGVYTLSVNVPGCGVVTTTIPVTINVCRDGQDTETSEPNMEMLTESDLSITVYPNPFARELSYTTTGLSLVRVYLFDMNGRVMHQITQPESNGIIPDAERLPAGVYFLRFETAQGYRVVKVMRQ